jgi:hypothetical protein
MAADRETTLAVSLHDGRLLCYRVDVHLRTEKLWALPYPGGQYHVHAAALLAERLFVQIGQPGLRARIVVVPWTQAKPVCAILIDWERGLLLGNLGPHCVVITRHSKQNSSLDVTRIYAD